MYEKHFGEKKCFEHQKQLFVFFGRYAKIFQPTSEKTPAGLSKLHSMRPYKRVLGRLFFFETCVYVFFRTLRTKTSDFLQNLLERVVETAFHVSIGPFREKLFFFYKKTMFLSFSDAERKAISILSNIFRHRCLSYFPCVHWINFSEMNVVKKIFFGTPSDKNISFLAKLLQ